MLFKLFQNTLYPFTVILTIGATFFLTKSLKEEEYIYVPGILLIFFIILFLLGEKFAPYRKDWQRNEGDVSNDILQTFIILPTASKIAEALIPIVFYYPLLYFSPEMFLKYNHAMGVGTFFTSFFVALLCCELLYYWFHRFSHKIPLLWKFHAVHHGAQRVYWLNSGRFHVIESFFGSFVYFLPLVFLGVGSEITILIITFSSITGFMEHVNINFKAGYLNYIFNTAELHRWHHSNQMTESNRNFGKALSIWDVIFGTFYRPKNKQVNQVGIENEDVPIDFLGQLKYPFKRNKISD